MTSIRCMRVLGVEDQKRTASFIRKALLADGFAVDVAEDGETALELTGATTFDAIVLDIMLPGRYGLSVLRLLRERRVSTPVLLLSARGEANERVEGLNAGADDYLPKPFVLDELLREAYEDARTLAEPHGIAVELGECDEMTVTGDRHRLRQLFLNLADNAVKHNQRNGRVTVTLRRAGEQARLEIANTGPGIAPDQLPFIFDPFYRGAEAQRAKRDGCGLGLSIAQWIVCAHVGTVAVTCDPGSLTTITVKLPLRD